MSSESHAEPQLVAGPCARRLENAEHRKFPDKAHVGSRHLKAQFSHTQSVTSSAESIGPTMLQRILELLLFAATRAQFPGADLPFPPMPSEALHLIFIYPSIYLCLFPNCVSKQTNIGIQFIDIDQDMDELQGMHSYMD